MYGADLTTFGAWGKAASGLPLRQCSRWSQRAHEHTSTRAHDTQPIPPQKNLTIRGSTSPATAQKNVTKTPRCASLPRHTATQAPTVSSIIPAARTETRRTRHAAPQKTPHPTPPRPNRSPLHPKHPMSPAFHRGGLHFEQARGGFATIDPRHAGDTPQSSAHGSNSPQATNENKPHHHDQHTKTCRTRPTQPPKEHATLAHPSNHGGFCDHRPPTRRRHAAKQRLW